MVELSQIASGFDKGTKFFRLVRGLERALDVKTDEKGGFRHEKILFRAHNSLGFPASDVESVDVLPRVDGLNEKVRVTVNFMGLYGPASPLPTHYTEEVLNVEDGDNNIRHFLDIFHHGFIGAVFRIWKKYRVDEHAPTDVDALFNNYVYRSLGLERRNIESESLDEGKFRALVPLLVNKGVTKKNLEKIVRAYLNIESIRIEEGVTSKLAIHVSQMNRLGSRNSILGQSCALGANVTDSSSQIKLVIGPIGFSRFRDLEQGTDGYRQLRALVNRFIGDEIDFRFDIWLTTKDLPSVTLARDCKLGLGRATWLSRVNQDKVLIKQN